MNKTTLNPWVWLVILVGFTGVLLELSLSGRILIFLHPRMVKFAYFALVIFICLLGYQVYSLWKGNIKPEPFKWGYLLYILPLVLFMLNPQVMNAEILANKAVNYGIQPAITSTESSVTEAPIPTESMTVVQIDQEPVEDDFYNRVASVQNNLSDHMGETVILEGFVYKQESFEATEFVVGRMLITCCAADAAVIGMLCQHPDGETLQADSWVRVVGTVEKTLIKDEATGTEFSMPILKLTELTPIEPHATPYVYE
jgi:putative membrane protein